MNNLDEIKKRLAYAKNNDLFDAHYINDMNWLIENNQAHLTTCSDLMKMIDLKDQAIIKASVEFTKFMKHVFHPNEKEYRNLKVLIEKLIGVPGLELPPQTTMYDEAWKDQENNFKKTEEKTCL